MNIPLHCIIAAGLAAQAHAAVILTDNFTAAGTTNGSIVNWTETGANLFGGIGTEAAAKHPGGTGSGIWAYFQTNETSAAGMYRSTLTSGLAGDTITLTFDFGGNTNSDLYTGTFTVSLWDGDPTVGGSTQLASLTPVNPASGAVSPITLQTTLVSNTAGSIYVRFNAGVTSPGSGFDQPIIDNVVVTLVPEPSACLFGALGLSVLLRRRR
ncbi:hypothetical protein KBB96_09820 [Luteolibacter ambystomatis]|uniref:PEP-CTERM sorting domain-containing protein n=1 Tax=Luteolibacter ambystomatis TaxID=2824561 RepID=A0A975J380_9BACT|nr:hypothetical protein [Luteolibacter ambystomatis]QUE53178.1 hypothetical protein KBB96_09820 [Luteolibacter ambystomatis]